MFVNRLNPRRMRIDQRLSRIRLIEARFAGIKSEISASRGKPMDDPEIDTDLIDETVLALRYLIGPKKRHTCMGLATKDK